MFIYTGKLEWSHYGVDELFVVVLPNGPVRLNDTVYLSSQWTVDSKGFKKQKWFSAQTVQKVTKADNGDDSFYLHSGWYAYNVQSQNAYQSISITMSNPGGGKSTMVLDRVYQPKGDVAVEAARIWTGRFDWPEHATDEPFLAVVPEGFGSNKPVLVFWQWTTDAQNKTKVPCALKGVQEAETPKDNKIKFSFTDHYSLDCTWDETTEALAIHMKEPGKHEQDIGPFKLAALVEYHSDEITPPDLPLEKNEFDVRYPQAGPSLPRIQAPLPFPRTLIDTLSHTASYVDQAGYLAKYALNRYHALDKAYHALNQQVDELGSEIGHLNGKVNELTTTNENQKKGIDLLQKKLVDAVDAAAVKEVQLLQQVQSLQETLAKEKTHDAEDHKALEEAHKQVKEEKATNIQLQKHVVALQFALAESDMRVKDLQTKVSELSQDVSLLRGQLETEKEHNATLMKENGELKTAVATAETETAALKKSLERTAEDLKNAQDVNDEKDKIITGLEEGLVAIKKDRDSKQTAYDELKKSTSETIRELQDEITKLKAGGTDCWPSNPIDGSLPPPFRDMPYQPMDEKWWRNMGMDENMARRLGLGR